MAILEERFANSANVTVSKIDVSTFEADRQYDTIVMMNVLEHIEDDAAAVAALREGLKSGGRLVVYVPAFMLLYSKFDREIGHYRRYKREPLASHSRDKVFGSSTLVMSTRWGRSGGSSTAGCSAASRRIRSP